MISPGSRVQGPGSRGRRAAVPRVALALLALAALPAPARADGEPTAPLADYVRRADPSFAWTVRHEAELGDARVAELRLVSQTWQGVPWKHRVFVLRPKALRAPEQALLFVTGGAWRASYDEAPGAPSWPGPLHLAAAGANQAGVCLVMVEQIPFQPMFDGLREDALIAYTFAQWLATGRDDWPLLFPMVKGAVRAMDAAQAFLAERWDVPVKRFMVTGASKRGWTTWLTGAVDPRVNAIAPMVIDVLNIERQMPHQLASWGRYSEQIADYTARGLPELAATPQGRRLLAMVDPWSYRKALTMPKVLLMGTNDRYWPIDAANLYWEDLEGANWLCYVPNNGHGLADLPRVVGAIAALARHASGERAVPRFSWRWADDGDGGARLTVLAREAPLAVRLWSASSPDRDFRPSKWAADYVEPGPTIVADGAEVRSWRVTVPRPAQGWRAVFGEVEFDATGPTPGAQRVFLSTTVRLLSDGKPEDF